MKVKQGLLLSFLKEKNMTAADLAKELEVELSEADKLLAGDAVCKRTAYEFIAFVGADEAQRLIDWTALNKINPLACEADRIYSDYPFGQDE